MNVPENVFKGGFRSNILREKTRFAFLKVVACLLTTIPLVGKAHADEEINISTLDGPRTAIILPAGRGPQPTVIVLHGALTTAEMTIRATGFAQAAAHHRFTAVFPQGLRRRWNDGRLYTPYRPDDVRFLRELTGTLIRKRIAKPGHIYLAGISNGGMMSFAMACKAGKMFRGVGTVIASMPARFKSCRLHPMMLVMINGTNDPLVPYEGGGVGFFRKRGRVLSVEQTARMFAVRNRCTHVTKRLISDQNRFDGSTVTRITWRHCRSGRQARIYRIEGGGHQVPGGFTLPGLILGRSNQEISAAEAIMSAFAHEDGRLKK
jgi:polyhydroxybutyrate depolymerase